jgi:hypothetical protein
MTMFPSDFPAAPNFLWQHRKTGDYYHILGFATEERTGLPVVVYQQFGGATNFVWTRPCAEFFDGRFRQVYNLAEDDAPKGPMSVPPAGVHSGE